MTAKGTRKGIKRINLDQYELLEDFETRHLWRLRATRSPNFIACIDDDVWDSLRGSTRMRVYIKKRKKPTTGARNGDIVIAIPKPDAGNNASLVECLQLATAATDVIHDSARAYVDPYGIDPERLEGFVLLRINLFSREDDDK